MKISKLNRQVHRWGSILFALPLLVIIISGIILQLKKEIVWLQPPTQKGSSKKLLLSFDEILAIAKQVPEAAIADWEDIHRLEVRPGKGMLKVRAKNSWEIQIDSKTGEILNVAIRRSDLVESIHDGSFFHDRAKLWIFLPTALVLAVLFGTGIYLFLLPYLHHSRRRRKNSKFLEQAE